MGVIIIIVAIVAFLLGLSTGFMVDFDWKAYFDYKIKHDEAIYKSLGEGGSK